MSSPTHIAVVIHNAGSPNYSVVSETVSTHEPGQDELLVRVDHTSFTPFDLWASAYQVAGVPDRITLGGNYVGQVEKVGPGVSSFAAGDQVFGFSRNIVDQAYNAFQERVLVTKYSVGKLPSNVDPLNSSTIVDNLITAIWSLTVGGLNLRLPFADGISDTSLPDKDAPILIWGGATSVGQYAIQALRHAGYTQIHTTASPSHTEYLKSLGAASVTPYSSQTVVSDLLSLVPLPFTKFRFAFVAAGDEFNLQAIAQVVSEGGKVAALLPIVNRSEVEVDGKIQRKEELAWETKTQFAKDVVFIPVSTLFYQQNEHFKTTIQLTTIPQLVASGAIKPNRARVIGRVRRSSTTIDVGEAEDIAAVVKRGLDEISSGKVRGERLVFSFV